MSWASHPTAEMPGLSPGSPGRHRRRGPSAFGVLVAAVLLLIAVSGAVLAPVHLGWPLVGGPAATGSPSTVATTPVAMPTPTPTPTPTPAPTPTPTPAPSPSTTTAELPPSPAGIPALEDEVFALTNAERAEADCPPLRLDERLRAAARGYSDEMMRYGAWEHVGHDGSDPGERLRRAGYDTSGGWAENIAKGYPSPQAVMKGWMGSTPHRRNILNCDLRALGVGVVRDGDGRLYWTQDFGGR